MQAIITLLEAGLALIPIPYGQKRPPPGQIGWNLPGRAITNPAQAHQLAGMNVGLAHAYCTPTPTCALDIDFYDGAAAWFAEHDLDLTSYLAAPDALLISSGKPQSRKALYRLPPDIQPLPSIKVTDKTGEHARVLFELRCATSSGLTVHDVLPPSLHPDGDLYRWANPLNTDPAAMPTLPPTLLSLWQSRLRPPTSSTPKTVVQAMEDTPRARAWLQRSLQRLSADCDRDSWRAIVWAVLSTGWHDAADIARAWSQTAPDRYTERDFDGVVNSYEPQREDTITMGTFVYLLRELDEMEAA